MNQPFFDIPDVMSFNGDRIVVRKYFEEFTNRKHKTHLQKKNEENLKDNHAKGLINRKIRLKMKAIITNWIAALQKSPVGSNGHKIYYPTFITLTLPATQFHTDKELHAKALHRFIQQIKSTHDVKNYVWRAERQENGNLHYHIIADKFIGWQLIRRYWTKIMNDLGYIDRYRIAQQATHKNGFHFNKQLSVKWTKEKQKSAYETGIRDNWTNPNCTDIHSLENIENVAGYICKYVTKSDEIDSLDQLKKAKAQETITEDFYDQQAEILQQVIDKKKINGRVWGCSDGLKEIKDPKIIVDATSHSFLTKVMEDKNSRIISDDNYTIIYNKKLKDFILSFAYIKAQVNEHHQNNFYHLHPEHKPVQQKKIIQSFWVPEWEPKPAKATQLQMIDW